MQEYLSGIAAILGVVLTAIGSFFAYRRSEIAREKKLAAEGRAGLLGSTAGIALSELNSRLYVEEFNMLGTAINRLARSNERMCLVQEAATKVEREKVEPLERASKEAMLMREALDGIQDVLRKREKREREGS